MALAHFQRTFADLSGNVQSGIVVTITKESDGSIATLFADSGGANAKANPFTTSLSGYADFYAESGRYRIQATGIDWRDQDLISQPELPLLSGGTSANFTTMPQVGGDPIVESGSNADGAFTRFADGTQVATAVVTVNFNGDVNFPSRRVYPSPVAFLFNQDLVAGTVGASATVTNLYANGRSFSNGLIQAFELAGGNPGGWVLATLDANTANAGAIKVSLLAVGRWF